MSPKTKFNLLLEPDQISALRKIQDVTGAPVAEQIRRAIGEWIAKRGSLQANPLLDGLREIGAMPPSQAPAIDRSVKHIEKKLRRTHAVSREIDAIDRGERSEKEIDRLLKKNVKGYAAPRRVQPRRKA